MRFEAPETIEAAVALLAGETGMAKVLAGGTDLLVQLRSGMTEPDLIVDIKRITGMHEITAQEGGFRIGAAVSGVKLARHDEVVERYPGVVEAFNLIGSTQIQGRATLSGNLCNASPAADSVPALAAIGAVARISGPDGHRDIAVEKIAIAPGKTSLEKSELVHSVFLPAQPAGSADAYLRFIPRTEMDIAVVGAGISITVDDDGVCTAARCALGAVAATIVVADKVAEALIGTRLDDEALRAASHAASAACNPIDDKRGTIEFRKDVAGVLTRRAAKIAYDRALIARGQQ